MLEKIISINDNSATLKLNTEKGMSEDLISLHLVFDDGNRKILGEIENIEDDIVHVQFLGEFLNNNFVPGIIHKPKLISNIRLVSKEELDVIFNTNDDKSFSFGNSVLYHEPVNVNIDALFSNHIAIFGNTGSGKSYGVSKILQSLFYNPKNIAINSTFVLFDVHSEYHSAFRNLSTKNPNYKYKLYAATVDDIGTNLINIPLWLLDIEDIAVLLNATEYSQLSIIERALYILAVITKRDEFTNQYLNHILAKSIQSIMYSGAPAVKIRSQIFEILAICSTPELNPNAIIPGIGYTRVFRKCFDIGDKDTFAENLLIGEYLEKLINDSLENKEVGKPGHCTLIDLEKAFNFVIVSENMLNNDRLYNSAVMLRMKLHSLIVSGYNKYFNYPQMVAKDGYLYDLLTINRVKAQILCFDIEGLDSKFAYFVTRTISKMLLNYVTSLQKKASLPINIFLEEAHRFIRGAHEGVFGDDVFEKIAREGRKYGVILTLISQRPTELSETVLSQCSSFLLFRTNHPRDLEYMKKAIPNINTEIIDKQRNIQPGYCVGLGKAFKIPMIIKLEVPEPSPESNNAQIFDIWSGHMM